MRGNCLYARVWVPVSEDPAARPRFSSVSPSPVQLPCGLTSVEVRDSVKHFTTDPGDTGDRREVFDLLSREITSDSRDVAALLSFKLQSC